MQIIASKHNETLQLYYRMDYMLSIDITYTLRDASETFYQNFSWWFWHSYFLFHELLQNHPIIMDKCDIKLDTKYDMYVIADIKLNMQTKIEGSDREIRDGVVTP